MNKYCLRKNLKISTFQHFEIEKNRFILGNSWQLSFHCTEANKKMIISVDTKISWQACPSLINFRKLGNDTYMIKSFLMKYPVSRLHSVALVVFSLKSINIGKCLELWIRNSQQSLRSPFSLPGEWGCGCETIVF